MRGQQGQNLGGKNDTNSGPGRPGGAPEIARHFCAHCMALTFREDPTCVHCAAARPAQGWGAIAHSGDPWLGRVMQGRYLITRRMGKGASALVYEAESLIIPRQFAIKVVDLHAGEGTRDPKPARARLRRELTALSRLRNPHIVSIFEILELSGVCVGVVMDFVPGLTLSQLLHRHGPLSWPRACDMLRQLARAAHAAHAAGLVHRDLKPANIMVETLAGGDEFMHLLDFGIVWADDGAAITRGFVGTPLYSSPEQAMGRPIDPRSDIYSLGAIFFEMLTGRPPFESSSIMEVLRMQVRQQPPTLQQAAEGRAFPKKLQRLVQRMLMKAPANRPEDLIEVIGLLDKIRRPDAAPPAPAPRLDAPDRPRRPAPAGLTLAGHGVLANSANSAAADASAARAPLSGLAHLGPLRAASAPQPPFEADGFLLEALQALKAIEHPPASPC